MSVYFHNLPVAALVQLSRCGLHFSDFDLGCHWQRRFTFLVGPYEVIFMDTTCFLSWGKRIVRTDPNLYLGGRCFFPFQYAFVCRF